MGATWRLALVLGLLAAAAAVVYLVPSVRDGINTAALYGFPVTMDGWTATEGLPDWALPGDPRERAAIRRTYRRGQEQAWVSVAVFTRQDDVSRRASINLIYPERNSSLLEPVPISLSLSGGAGTELGVPARLVHQERQRILVAYWHQIGRRSFGREVPYRLALMRDLILSRRGDSVLVRIAVPVEPTASTAAPLRTIKALAPLLHRAVNETLGFDTRP
ncbi:MAG TPA: EpsI family protein [Methylomirabilota bacterium]|nr:EpsI family protein [Methylomirabilota bacterium]